MTQINRNELLEILMNLEKGTFIHMVTETKVKMNKTGNPYFAEGIVKRNSRNYLTGVDYGKRVTNQYGKEGLNPETFEVEQMKGKEHVSKCVSIDTKTRSKYYLSVEPFDEVQPFKTEYFYQGNTIDKQLFESYRVKVSENKKQETERKVQWLTFDIANIRQISINKEVYEVVSEVVVE
jgi:hypothetical protein